MEGISKNFENITQIGSGRFSYVYKVQNRRDYQFFALKEMTSDSKIPEPSLTFYREVQALSISNHPNIIKLYEIIQKGPSISLVMEYMPYTISDIIHSIILPESIIKGFTIMILRGIAHLHEIGIIHRDIKPENLLLNSKGVLKICDLGLCRILPDKLTKIGSPGNAHDETHAWTLQVGTSFYRSPELLLGDSGYNESIDMWSIGCVIAELFTGKPLFPGQGDIEQLMLISNLLGSPDEKRWPGFSQLPGGNQIMFLEKEPSDPVEFFPLLT